MFKKSLKNVEFYFNHVGFCYLLFHSIYLLILCGDIEPNPGPKDAKYLSLCHWNLNSITAHNLAKVSALKAFNTTKNFDFICLSESYLDSTISSDDKNLCLDGYKLIRADHPKNIKQGGVCIYYRKTLPLKIIQINYLPECLVCEINYDKRKIFIVTLYRSPSQTADKFNEFLSGFEGVIDSINQCNPYFTVITGDFNVCCNRWWVNDSSNTEGVSIDNLTSSYGLKQLIAKPTHILPTSSSCIGLLFTNQTNMVVNSGVFPPIPQSCHHQIVFAKINLKIFYPPPYTQRIWDYSNANHEAINNAIDGFDWEKAFSNVNVHTQVKLFNETLSNIFMNFVPNKLIAVDDRDPPWMTEKIKKLLKDKSKSYKLYIKNGRKIGVCEKLLNMTNNITTEISNSKRIYLDKLAEKLSGPKLNWKASWGILKSFTNWKKIPIIPPLLINDQLVTNFNEKANNFNQSFSNQCSVIDKSSKLPLDQAPYTTSLLSSIDITEPDILNILKSLDANKAHGHHDISIRMLKLSQKSILKPLKLIFENCLGTRQFPDQWKKGNVVPIHKKGDKQLIENYRPVSLLPICGKVFERLIFNSLFNYFIENNLFSPHQSGFIPGDSCVQQLISITHEIYNAFDCNPSLEVRGVFLDISKALDKVWHDGLIYKLKRNGINGDLSRPIESFLSDRYQRVVLNGQTSNWNKIKAGVSQGSILAPLFFLI